MGDRVPFSGVAAALVGFMLALVIANRKATEKVVVPETAGEPPRADRNPVDLNDLIDRQLLLATESDERLERYLRLMYRVQWFPVPLVAVVSSGIACAIHATGMSWLGAAGIGVTTAGSAITLWVVRVVRRWTRMPLRVSDRPT